MNNHDWSLRQLQYAIAVRSEGGFGRAAKRAGVSQPALSAQIGSLEQALGVQLFERTSRTVRPTPEGGALLDAMEALLLAADDLEALAATARAPDVVRVRFGVIHTLAPYVVPALVRALEHALPQVRAEWVEGLTESLEAGVSDGDLDLALTATPPGSGLVDRKLGDDPFSLVAAQGAVDLPSRLDRLDPERLLLLDEGHCLREQALSACGRVGGGSACRATSLATLVQLVSADLGVTLLPASALRVEVRHAAIRVVPLLGAAPSRTVRLVWRPSSPRVALLGEFAATCSEVIASITR